MMKRYIYHYITLLLIICFSVSSCQDLEMEALNHSMYVELKVSCVNLNETRVTMPGDNNLNENKIETLHYFLYPAGMSNKNAVLAGKIVADKLNGTNIQIPLNEGILNDELIPFPNNTCEVFLIANLPSDVTIDIDTRENTSLPELEAKVIATRFTAEHAEEEENGTGEGGTENGAEEDDDEEDSFIKQDSFVMTGKGVATLLSRKKTNAAEGTISLQRLAAKYTVRISVQESVQDENDVTWNSLPESMTIHVVNAANETKLSGAYSSALFDYHDRTYIGTQGSGENTKYLFDPFYSYPCQWQFRDEEAFVLYVMLPWEKEKNIVDGNEDGNEEGNEYHRFYYKVFPNTTQLDRNCWYNVDLNIGVLGSFNQTESTVNIEPTYSVMDWNNGQTDWQTGVDEQTEILGAKYLIVDKNQYVVNNQDEFEIPFISSDPCEFVSLTMTNTVFGYTNDSEPSENPITTTLIGTNKNHYQLGDNADDWLKIDGNTIKLRHALKNDFINTDDYDYSPYTFTFTFQHKGNSKFRETITIIQKPAISITAHLNSLYEHSSGKTVTGYVYVNGNAAGGSTSSTYSAYGGVAGVQTSGTNNTNPYMYTIEISVLPAGSEFILGDPRVKYVFGTDIAAQDKFYSATPVGGGNSRHLTNYYGTIRDASAENMIAPKFRMASAHGRVSSSLQNYTNTLNRAASYQEDGYPAGRWRVPTMAEIRFVTKLYADRKIPPLFSSGTGYWCATGKVTPSNDGTVRIDRNIGNTTCAVRCVYDDWYWEHSQWPRMNSRGDHPNKYNQFTWGDEN